MLTEYEELLEQHGTITAAAKALGIPRTTLRDRVRKDTFKTPEFPESDIPIQDVLDYISRRYEQRVQSYDAHTWYPIEFMDNKPIGVLWFGDPHLGDNGCNVPELIKHTEYCANVEGLYGVNIGDSSNNWSGRLSHLYAEQDTSKKTERRLVEWLMHESGVKWLAWLIGNHDAWSDGGEILSMMGNKYGTHQIVCHDWEARFRLVFPNTEYKVYASHDFKGHSMWNPMHGPMKAGMIGQEADIYVSGHKHNWGTFTFENTSRGKQQHFIRVRGYKFMDEYARRLGILEQTGGCSILTVFNPKTKTMTTFEDIDSGVKFLEFMRSN